MKKIFLISLTFLFLSCTSDSDDNANNSNNQITPPTWIQGTWLIYSDTPFFKFKTNDFCALGNNTESCYDGIIKNSQGNVKAQQVISDIEYKLSIITQSSLTTIYHFRKLSNTKIEYIQDNGQPNLELIKQ